MTEFLVMLGVVFGGAVLIFIYINFIKPAQLAGKSLEGKVESLLKKDLSAGYAGYTFYQYHNYDKPYSQKEWKILYEIVQTVTQNMDKSSEEYAKLAAPFINAIVVDESGYYARRGMENRAHSGEKLICGVNDKIGQKYCVEPYKYVKDEARATKYAEDKARHAEETKDLRAAQERYRAALRRYNEHKGTRSESFYEADMQAAHAAMLSAQIAYDNRKK